MALWEGGSNWNNPTVSQNIANTGNVGVFAPSTSMTPGTMATYAGIASAISGIGSAYAQSMQYDIAEINAKTKAAFAKVQGEADALTMLKNFNKAAATDAVMAAAQGRSGGSVNQIARAAEEQLNWDMMFSKISTGVTVDSMMSQASQMKLASKQALFGGSLSSISDAGINIGTSLYNIGGSTKEGSK